MAKLSFAQAIKNLFSAHNKEDTEFFEDLADALIEGDIGAKNAMELVDQLEKECKEGKEETRARAHPAGAGTRPPLRNDGTLSGIEKSMNPIVNRLPIDFIIQGDGENVKDRGIGDWYPEKRRRQRGII